ncbi:FXSXX-COOH family cyclophane-modified RiPP peptide SjiA [Streptacidiphilus pinicola]|uniref:FXSXX-COOH family cyclophane-modified RiPP peptide SjiA n=1 Tax=Streptacidiphilus pinicola TaxID=2219663 RepID=UPI003C736C88
MSATRDTKSRATVAGSVAAAAAATVRPVPVRLAKRGDAAHSMMLSRVLPDNGVSRLDVAGFQSSI